MILYCIVQPNILALLLNICDHTTTIEIVHSRKNWYNKLYKRPKQQEIQE